MAEAQPRQVPLNDLDLQMQMTNSSWGKSDVPEGLKNRLKKLHMVKDDKGIQVNDPEGNPIATTESLWDLLGFYTRDMRLANLSVWNGEIDYCRYYLDLANDLLHSNFIEPFLICLSRVATVLELSQSKNGFLRRRMGTFTQENKTETMEPPKKTLFGGPGGKKP